jgi:hypothetical protein
MKVTRSTSRPSPAAAIGISDASSYAAIGMCVGVKTTETVDGATSCRCTIFRTRGRSTAVTPPLVRHSSWNAAASCASTETTIRA